MESPLSPDKDRKPLFIIFGISSLILFLCASLRHWLLQSTAFDLGIFDQAIYLISQGKAPFSTLMGIHILGDHATLMHYLCALLYAVWPSVQWLFLIQACALSAGIFPIYSLAIDAGLSRPQAEAMALVYLLSPIIFNSNLFDFHPEVIAIPFLLWSILAMRRRQFWVFLGCIILILSCKAVLSLTILGLGVWIFWLEKNRKYGLVAIALGLVWFILSTQWIIPIFSGAEAGAVGRYSYLGDSVLDILLNLFLKPQQIFSVLFSSENLGYLALLFIPVLWGWSRYSFAPLVAAFPALSLNLLADYLAQKDLVHHYSLPILPFLILGLIASLAKQKGLFQQRRQIILWSLFVFICLSKFTYFGGRYLSRIDNIQQAHAAIALIETQGSVYTNAQITPHVTHRELVKFTRDRPEPLNPFAYILLDERHPGWASDGALVQSVLDSARQDPTLQIIYEQHGIFLFRRT